MEMKDVVIACPIRNRAWILPYYLEHIYNLDYPKDKISLLWVLNQSNDLSESILRAFQKKHRSEYKKIQIVKFFGNRKVPKDDRVFEVRQNYIYQHLAEIRNHILELSNDNDYLFSLDCDVLVAPNSLKQLISHQKDIVSSVIYNGYKKEPLKPWIYPNVLKLLANGTIEHIANSYVKNAPYTQEPQLQRADVTGAATLISKRAFSSARYSYHKQGEDIPFCLSCKENGFEIWYDAGCFSNHIMSEEHLQEYLKTGEINEKKSNFISTYT